MKRIYFFCTLILCFTNCLEADTVITQQTPRIAQLLPDIKNPPSVEPFLPENFVLVKYEEGSYKEHFWAPNDLDGECIDPQSIKVPFIHVMEQDDIKSFDRDIKKIIAEMRKISPRNFRATFSHWGDAPLVNIQMMIGNDTVHLAYVGLDVKEEKALIFHLVYPCKKEFGKGNSPSAKDLIFWNNFLNKTTPLNKPLEIK